MTDPFDLFDAWYREARETEINDSNAMALATADAEGRPSVRMVLLKGHDPNGFVFYTNQRSRKGAQLAQTDMSRCFSTGSRCDARSASKAPSRP